MLWAWIPPCWAEFSHWIWAVIRFRWLLLTCGSSALLAGLYGTAIALLACGSCALLGLLRGTCLLHGTLSGLCFCRGGGSRLLSGFCFHFCLGSLGLCHGLRLFSLRGRLDVGGLFSRRLLGCLGGCGRCFLTHFVFQLRGICGHLAALLVPELFLLLQLLTFMLLLRIVILALAQSTQHILCLLMHTGNVIDELRNIRAEFLSCVLHPDFCH